MKQLYLILLALAIGNTILNAQIVNIPDPVFKNYLVNVNCVDNNFDNTSEDDVDTNNDGEIQVSEAAAVLKLTVGNALITSVEGLEAFTNILHFNVYLSELTELDASVIPTVENLRFSSTPTLTSVDLTGLSNLETLYVRNTGLSNIDLSPLTNAKEITISDNNITSLDASNLPDLEILSCYNSPILTSIVANGSANLRELYFHESSLSAIDLSGLVNLEVIRGFNNNLSSINLSGLTLLDEVQLRSNQLQDIVFNNNSSLRELYIDDNSLSTLDLSGLNNLETLGARENDLESINVSSGLDNLSRIFLSRNQLSSIDLSSASNLTLVDVSDNDLGFIDITNLPMLNGLFVHNNRLSSIDFTGTSQIRGLDVSDNLFPYLDFTELTNGFIFRADNNPNLQELYFKNGNDDFSGVPGEQSSFGNCPNLTFVCVDPFEETTVQNLIASYGYTNVTLTTSCPNNPGNTLYEVSGTAQFDENTDGCDINDAGASYLRYEVSDGTNTGVYIGSKSGQYSFPVGAGMYNITPILENPNYFTVTPSTFSADFPTDASPLEQDVCLEASGNFPDVAVTLIPTSIARPGFNATYELELHNYGNSIESGTVTLSYPGNVLNLVTSTPAPSSQNSSQIIWDYSSLIPFNSQTIEFTFILNSPTSSPPLNNGDILNYEVSVTPINDENPIDNTMNLDQNVVNSFDPNNKICLEGESIYVEDVGKFIHYQINFENNGTAPAQKVLLKDFIDTRYFEVETLQPIAGSHEFTTTLIDNLVSFNFNNINLPFDEPNNRGYVVFKIKSKNTLEIGDVITNQAAIYFDFNEPIITNLANTTVIDNLSVDESQLRLQVKLVPNPAITAFNVYCEDVIDEVKIFDHLGKEILTKYRIDEPISIVQLSTGIYFVKVVSNDKVQVLKLIKN